jgi:hypothetical protein
MRQRASGGLWSARAAPLVAAIAGAGLSAAAPAFAQAKCDAALHPVGGGDGYRLRGDRCEGIYARAVALGEVHLVGVNWRPGPLPPIQAGRALKLAWEAPAGKPVHVRAWALRPRLFYRLDSVRPAGASAYDWPTELLMRLNLSAADLGVIAWTPVQLQGGVRDVLLPVRVGGGGGAAPQHVELTLLSDVQLKEVYLTAFPIGPDGKPGPAQYKDVAVKRGYYPANRGITVPLPALSRPGYYRIDIGSSFTGGGASALSQLIYLAKPSG